jgi:hypothetical protein
VELAVHLLGHTVLNRNLSMTEWNELIVEVLPMKEPARAAGKGAPEDDPDAH